MLGGHLVISLCQGIVDYCLFVRLDYVVERVQVLFGRIYRERRFAEIKNIEENGATLSGGEKKKLLMLKWLLNPSTSFVILDEIDAGLDDETKAVLKELEKELLKDRKKIVMKISHIDEDMDGYDQIIRL